MMAPLISIQINTALVQNQLIQTTKIPSPTSFSHLQAVLDAVRPPTPPPEAGDTAQELPPTPRCADLRDRRWKKSCSTRGICEKRHVPLFHIAGITPECQKLEDAGGVDLEIKKVTQVKVTHLDLSARQVNCRLRLILIIRK